MDVVSIWNMALGNIGSTALLSSINDTNKAAQQSNLWWPLARQKILRAYGWPFASQTVTLQQIPASVYQPPEYAYAFGYPADCLRAIELLSPAGRRPPGPLRIPFIVRASPTAFGAAGTTRYILTDLAPGTINSGGIGSIGSWDDGCDPWWSTLGGLADGTQLPCLRYTADIQDPTAYTPEFIEALAWQLASYLAMPMAQNKGLKTEAEQMARRVVLEAVGVDMNEQQNDQPLDSEPGMARQ